MSGDTPASLEAATLLQDEDASLITSSSPRSSRKLVKMAVVASLAVVLLGAICFFSGSLRGKFENFQQSGLIMLKKKTKHHHHHKKKTPPAYKLQKGTCSQDSFTGGGDNCFAPWVYCTDANCDQNLVESKYTPGVLAARCHCWMPKNTNYSIIPKETAGAGCVADQVTPGKAPFGVTGGTAMCDQMKAGKLISTYGPTGTSDIGKKIHAKAVKCKARTKWAWCWGAPCMEDELGQITCECPIVISDWDETQYVSVSDVACGVEKGLDEGPCSVIHNGSPAGESPMQQMSQCE